MKSEQSQKPESLVRSQRGALASNAASALVKRGLQDLSFTGPRWSRQHLSDKRLLLPKVSPLGYVAGSLKSDPGQSSPVAIYNPETGQGSVLKGRQPLVWSPCGKYIGALAA